MTSPVFTPLQMFFNTSGAPLTDGYIYIGTASQNPQTNPIAVYWDAAGTIPAAQPIRTSGGYPVRNGSPATVFVLATDFSLIVRDKSSSLVFSRLSGNAFSAEWVTYTPAGTGAVATTVQAKLRESVSVLDFGAVGDGVTDDANKFVTANTAVGVGGAIYVTPGIYRFASNTTINAVLVFSPGAILKPSTGIKVTLTQKPEAGAYQIFDRSGGGAVEFNRAPEVYAEWWGARGGPSGRTDNNIPIQYALDAVQSVIDTDFTTPAPNPNNNGGAVILAYSTDYLMSGRIHLRSRARILGQGRYSELKINNATWGTDTEMVLSQNGTNSQFWCRLENLTVNANENTVITRVIYAPAWQESCGLRDVLIENFRCHGVYLDTGYGGAVGSSFKSVQFFPSQSIASAKAMIYANFTSYSVGVYNLLLDEISFAGWTTAAPPGIDLSGLFATGRVRIQCKGVFMEGVDYGITLDTDASLYGVLGAGGNPSTNSVIACNSSWTGEIDCPRIGKGGATYLVRSFAASPTNIYRDVEPVFHRVVYPHTPSEIMAYCRNTAAGGTLDSTAFGFSSISRTGAGQYTINFDAAKFAPNGGTAYRTRVEIGSVAGSTYYVAGQTSSSISLVFKNLANVAADCDLFDVFVYGRPGL
jgi:hypothetical protein